MTKKWRMRPLLCSGWCVNFWAALYYLSPIHLHTDRSRSNGKWSGHNMLHFIVKNPCLIRLVLRIGPPPFAGWYVTLRPVKITICRQFLLQFFPGRVQAHFSRVQVQPQHGCNSTALCETIGYIQLLQDHWLRIRTKETGFNVTCADLMPRGSLETWLFRSWFP